LDQIRSRYRIVSSTGFMSSEPQMTESEFLYRFRSGLVAAWIMPLAITFFVIGFLGDYSLGQLMQTLQHLVSVYVVIGIGLCYAAHDRYMRQTVELAVLSDQTSREEAEKRIARFPIVFAGLYLPYAVAAPLIVNFSLGQQLGQQISLNDHLFAIIGVTAPASIVVLVALYVFADLVGQFCGPRGFKTHFLSLRVKVPALAIVLPLTTSAVLILYVEDQLGGAGGGLFLVWLSLIALSLPVAYFALRNFKKGIDPLWDLRAQALSVFDDLDTIIEPVPVSLDEFGDVTRDWASLTRRMTAYWRELHRTTEHFQTLINAIEEAIAIVDFDMKAVFLGPGFSEWFDGKPSDFIGYKLSDLVHDDDEEHFLELAKEAIEAPDHRPEGQFRLRHPDGTYHRVLCSWRHIHLISGEPSLFLSLRDVSQQLTAQERLRAGEIRLRTMMQSVADGILSTDKNGVIQSVNPAASQLFGYDGDELIGSSVGILLPTYLTLALQHSSSTDGPADGLGRLVGLGAQEMRGQQKSGESFPLELSVTDMRIGDEHFYVSVVRDITEQKASEAELRMALTDAEAANRTKSLFLANMSHELRTPLNAVIGFSEVMQQEMFGPLNNERYLDYVGSIHDSSRHLLSVINDILDISRIESGEMELEDEWLELDEVLEWARDRAVPSSMTTAHAMVHMAPLDGLPEIEADRRALRQVVINLLSNAIKFTPPDGRIDLSAHVNEASGISIIVKDTGIGIPADQIEKMTQPFTQSDNSLARRFEGTGLGLAITKSLIEAHQGQLGIESTEGEGTTITVRLPAERLSSDGVLSLPNAEHA
jgi:PAS domain S-box-containing protein